MIWKFFTIFFFLLSIILISIIINNKNLKDVNSESNTRELIVVPESTPFRINVPTYTYNKSLEGLVSLAHNTMKYIQYEKPAGVAVYFFFNSPKWFQRRFTFIVENAINNIPRDWVVQLFLTEDIRSLSGLIINPGIYKHIEDGKVVLTLIPKEVYGKAPRKVLLLGHKWIWQNMLAEKVFLITGGVVCSNSPFSIKDFLHYDYIGAPDHSFGGDGDFSIRSRSLMLKAFEYNAIHNLQKENDPSFNINQLLKKMSQDENIKFDYKIATYTESLDFATSYSYANTEPLIKDTTIPIMPWGVIGTIPFLSNENREYFLLFCPELKVVFPSLHNPGCFGANPNPVTCSESICAINFNGTRGC